MPARPHPSMYAAMNGPPKPRPPLDERAEIARAVELARSANATVLVLGDAQEMSGEGASRTSFDLPGRQQELLDVVVATGRPVVAPGEPVEVSVVLTNTGQRKSNRGRKRRERLSIADKLPHQACEEFTRAQSDGLSSIGYNRRGRSSHILAAPRGRTLLVCS